MTHRITDEQLSIFIADGARTPSTVMNLALDLQDLRSEYAREITEYRAMLRNQGSEIAELQNELSADRVQAIARMAAAMFAAGMVSTVKGEVRGSLDELRGVCVQHAELMYEEVRQRQGVR